MRLLTMLLLLALPFSAITAEKTVIYDGCELVGHLPDADRTSFTIKVQDALYSVALSDVVKTWLGTAPDTTPARATTQVILRIGGVPVFFPYKAYADLGNPALLNGITLARTPEGINLYIRGGENGAAYTAKFVVLNGKLARREVVLANFPDSPPQIATFDK